MREVIITLESNSPYGQSRYYDVEKLSKELHKDYEQRTWRERGHYDEDGNMFIPAMQFQKCLQEAAKFLSMQIPGKGKATYTKHFEAGIMVPEGITLPYTKESVPGQWVLVPSDGKRGGTKRVPKCFPVIPKWEGQLKVYILDDTITADVFEFIAQESGKFIGIGFWRPRQTGMYGRFNCTIFDWKKN